MPKAVSVSLRIGDREIAFGTLAALEFGLDGRLQVTASRYRTLVELMPEELAREAKRVEQLETELIPLARAAQDPDWAMRCLHAIPIRRVCQEHDWQGILTAMVDGDAPYEARFLVLAKYLQYLARYRDLIAEVALRSHQHRLIGEGVLDGTVDPRAHALRVEGAARSTLATDATPPGFVPIGRDSPTAIPLQEGDTISILLCTHPFKILYAGDLWFMDEGLHTTCALRIGTNVIGRGEICDITVHSAYQDISRRHLAVEISPHKDTISLLDLSTHGSFLDAHWERAMR
jgi:hypothetical protein